MNRAPRLAPSWLPRQERRRVERELRKLLRRDACSLCNAPFKHNSRTTSGLDAAGHVVWVGECCLSQVTEVFRAWLYSTRKYNFLRADSNIEPTNEQIAETIAVYQQFVADTDKRIDDIVRHGGGVYAGPNVFLLDHSRKDADREWFERNPSRAHRVRMPFPSEFNDVPFEKTIAGSDTCPDGHTLIVLVKQVEPGARLRGAFYLSNHLLPVPDDEAVAHALYEVAMQHEPVPPNGDALWALIKKYTAHREADP
jgi:hypothetical protein